jgi:ketosteroid isomerase-like protein
MENELSDFESFMRRREDAARAYVSGDPGPLRDIAAQESPASFFGPQGGIVAGSSQVWSAYEQGAAAFGPGGDSHFEVVHMEASGDLAYWVGVQRADVNLAARSERTPMELRITEIFRREDGEWKLVHRHADQLESQG